MYDSPKRILEKTATLINNRGLHTGPQFAAPGPLRPRLDICAAIYVVSEGGPVPPEFYTDEAASLRLIACSADAMQAIRALSAALDSEPCTTEIAPGVDVPDYIEHVSNWAATAPTARTTPPSTSEVIGRILRAARACTTPADIPHQRTAA
jgi:hypothetical protein